MLERFQVQRRKVLVLTTRVGTTVLASDFAEYANNRAWIACLSLSVERVARRRRLVGHRRGANPLIEPSRQPVEIQKAAQTHGRIVDSRTPRSVHGGHVVIVPRSKVFHRFARRRAELIDRASVRE
jgi:hypothetical protein